ncbi:MAG: SusC/RagA family TonB-linked outer membrane protein [Cyclobacteriaceae bacterium]|nr:SusC/RagA family TonB-linked outer membrane protein [Cyclobacteriaceae bacterium]
MRKFLLLTSLVLMTVLVVQAQERTVSGTVTSSDDGSSLPGVNVLLQGTNAGAVSDIDGNYKIAVPDAGGVLVFSFIGYASKEVEVGSQTTINVALDLDVQQLSEVVITALGVAREKKTLGYATQEVKSENLRVARETNLNQSLAGKIAGVQVVSGSGAKFGNAAIRIRGVRGLNGSAPLYVVDGIIVPDANSINMDNVESVNVLKGASAAALYGNRARDGVIVITSKKGVDGQLSITFNNSTFFERVATLPEYQNEYGGGYDQSFKTFTYDPAVHDPGLAGLDGASYPNPMYGDESWGAPLQGQQVAQWDAWTKGTEGYGKTRPWEAHPDNIRNFYEKGVMTNNNLSVGKGGEDYNIMASISNSNRKGVLPGSDQKKNFLNLLTTVDLSEKLTLTGIVNYNGVKTNGNLDEGYGSIASNVSQWFQRQLDTDLLRKYYKLPDGTFTSWNILSPTNPNPLYWDNPYTMLLENKEQRREEVFFGKVGLTYEIIEGLKVSANMTRATKNNWFEGRTASGTLDTDRYRTSSRSKKEDNYEFLVTYNKQLNEDWSISALAGANNRLNDGFFWDIGTVGGLSVPNLYNLKASVDRPLAENEKQFKQVRSAYAQASVGFREMVYIDAAVRSDWSSSLPKDNNQYTYPSIATTFIFSELLQDQNILSFGKLRANYALVGSDIDPYQLDPTFTVNNPYGNTPTMTLPNTLPNVNLRPSYSESMEAGIAMNFLNNRITTDFAIYSYNNKDEIIQVSTPGSSGVNAAWVNSGLTVSKGYEFTIGGTPVKTNDFEWTISANGSHFENEVHELYPGLTTIRLGNGWGGTGTTGGWGGVNAQAKVPDETTGEVYQWGTIVGRAFQRHENGSILIESDPTSSRYGKPLTENDQILGNILPDFVGGIFNRFTYKDFDLALTIDWQKGGVMHSITRMFHAAAGLSPETVGDNDRGTPQRDPVADNGGIRFDGVYSDGTQNDVYLEANDYWWTLFGTHERWLYESSFVKLREVRLGYSLPKSLLGDMVKNVNVAVIANNPWLIYTAVDGIDPSEMGGQEVDARTNGAWVEGGQLPATRSLGFDIKISF